MNISCTEIFNSDTWNATRRHKADSHKNDKRNVEHNVWSLPPSFHKDDIPKLLNTHHIGSNFKNACLEHDLKSSDTYRHPQNPKIA